MNKTKIINKLKKIQTNLKKQQNLSDTDLVAVNDKVANVLFSADKTESELLGDYINNGNEVHDYLVSGRQNDLTPEIKNALSQIDDDDALYLVDDDYGTITITKVTQIQLANIIGNLIWTL